VGDDCAEWRLSYVLDLAPTAGEEVSKQIAKLAVVASPQHRRALGISDLPSIVSSAASSPAGITVPSIFDGASMAATVLRVRDVDVSVDWYREKLGLELIHVGADGPEHPFATFFIAGSTVVLWQLSPGQASPTTDPDTSSYVW
jgi:hypothetical protein